MLKRELFIAAMHAGLYKKAAWVISAFSLTREGPDDWKRDPYPYRIVRTMVAVFYVDPDSKELVKIEDAPVGEAIYRFKEALSISAADGIPSVDTDATGEEIRTSYGNLFFNYAVLIQSFGPKISFYNPADKAKVGKIEEIILGRLEDDPKPGDPLPKTMAQVAPIYVSEYLKFAEAMFYLTSFTQLCTVGATKKVLLPPPGLAAFKKQLLDLHRDHLDDKATIAKIDAALIKFDSDYLKGDPAENFLIDDKSRSTVRRKLFLMMGAEAGLDDNSVKAELIENSLVEGWDISKFPQKMNSLRAGSFNRGSQTQLGGVSVKWLLRASSNLNVVMDDCGSRMGNVVLFTAQNAKKYVGFSMVTQEGHKQINTEEEAGQYLGKKLIMRSPMFCKLSKTDFCKVCVGKRLSLNPDALSIAVADYGSAFLAIYMKAMHGKNLQLAKMDLKTAIF